MRINSQILSTVLSTVGVVRPEKSSLESVCGIDVKISPDKLIVSSTDLIDSVSVELTTESELNEDFFLSGLELNNLLTRLYTQDIGIDILGNILVVSTDNGIYEIDIIKGNNFPNISKELAENTFRVTISHLKDILQFVTFAVAEQDVNRPALTGVLITNDENGNAVSVGTNGGKFGRYTYQSEIKKEWKVIIPKSSIRKLDSIIKLLPVADTETCIASVDNGRLSIRFSYSGAEVVFVCGAIDSAYPNWQAIVPKEFETVVTVDSSLLFGSVKRLSIFSKDDKVCLKLKDKLLTMKAGKSSEQIDCTVSENIALDAYVNIRWFSEILQSTPEGMMELKISTGKPILISSLSNPNVTLLIAQTKG